MKKGSHLSEETKKQISKKLTGKKHTEKTKAKMSASHKGLVFTEEHRKNMSIAATGRKHKLESIEKMRIARTGTKHKPEVLEKIRGENHHNWGQHHSDETKAKIGVGQKGKIYHKGKDSVWWGRTHTEEERIKISEALKGKFEGEKNPRWKGGISYEPYCFAWSFDEFKQMIKDRDNNMCQNPMCNKTSSKLGIHHINYIKKDCEPSNLITLCNSCNSKANGSKEIPRESWQRLYTNLMIYNLRCVKEEAIKCRMLVE